MKSIEAPRTALELAHLLGASMSTLNMDINMTRPMPPVFPGQRGLFRFTESLKDGGLKNVAELLGAVHLGDKKLKKGKNFPNTHLRRSFEADRAIFADLGQTVAQNLTKVDSLVNVGSGQYRGANTRIGELMLTFYDLYLQIPENGGYLGVTYQRAETLSGLEGFTTSPLMSRVMQEVEAKQAAYRAKFRSR